MILSRGVRLQLLPGRIDLPAELAHLLLVALAEDGRPEEPLGGLEQLLLLVVQIAKVLVALAAQPAVERAAHPMQI